MIFLVPMTKGVNKADQTSPMECFRDSNRRNCLGRNLISLEVDMLQSTLMGLAGKFDKKSSISHVPTLPLLLHLPAKTLGEHVDVRDPLRV